MAKKIDGFIKLQIPAGKATPAPPVGPALGQKGVNIVQFTKEFNAKTADKGDTIIRVGSMDKYRVMGTWDLGIWVHKMTSKDPSSKMLNADRVDKEQWIVVDEGARR